jgi:branched-chain amino acid transport system ATP-binding protein
MLKVENIHAAYGEFEVLHGVSLHVPSGASVGLLGLNGAGKSTLLDVFAGLHKHSEGNITLEGHEVTNASTNERVRRGVALVPETRELFPALSVKENLRAGLVAHRLKKSDIDERIEESLALFPILREKIQQAAGLLSGGQQQMLAIARALTTRPKMLLLDEPSLGLAPVLVAEIYGKLKEMKSWGVSMLIVEQHVHEVMALCDYLYVLELGVITHSGSPAELNANPDFVKNYLGG